MPDPIAAFGDIGHPDSDSQGNSDFRKITRNLSLTFATVGDTRQSSSFLILIARFATLEGMRIKSVTPRHYRVIMVAAGRG